MSLYIYALLLGLVMGSFLNVCIWRLPRHESLLTPSSHCPSCGKSIAIYDNIPVVSFLLLRGRCRSCRQPISWRYPLVELANGLAYVMLLWRYGLGWPTAVYAALFSWGAFKRGRHGGRGYQDDRHGRGLFGLEGGAAHDLFRGLGRVFRRSVPYSISRQESKDPGTLWPLLES